MQGGRGRGDGGVKPAITDTRGRSIAEGLKGWRTAVGCSGGGEGGKGEGCGLKAERCEGVEETWWKKEEKEEETCRLRETKDVRF